MKRITFLLILSVFWLIFAQSAWTKTSVCVIAFENTNPGSSFNFSSEMITDLLLKEIKEDQGFEFISDKPGKLSCQQEVDFLLKGQYSLYEHENELRLDLTYKILISQTQAEIVKRAFVNSDIDSIKVALNDDLKTKLFSSVSINSVPSGAKIFLSDSLLGMTPLDVKLVKRTYSFNASPDEENYYPETIKLDLNTDISNYTIKFKPKAFRLTINSTGEKDTIYFDNKLIGLAPQVIETYARENHTLTFKGENPSPPPFKGAYFSLNGIYYQPDDKLYKNLYTSFIGGSIGIGAYYEIVNLDISFFGAQPQKKQQVHIIDTTGVTLEGDQIWMWGGNVFVSILIPLGYLDKGDHKSKKKFPIFPYGGVGYEGSYLNFALPENNLEILSERLKSHYEWTNAWYFKAGMVIGILNLGWKQTFRSDFVDWRSFYAGLAFKL